MLIPAAARPWLAPATRDRTWPSHGAMMLRRREALAALLPAYGAWPRLGLAALAWALGIGGAVLVGRGMAEESSAYSAGIGLLGDLLGFRRKTDQGAEVLEVQPLRDQLSDDERERLAAGCLDLGLAFGRALGFRIRYVDISINIQPGQRLIA